MENSNGSTGEVSEPFDSKSLGLRAQKKLLGKMTSKKIAKVFIDESSGRLLDNVHKLAKDYTGSQKRADSLLKNMIKTVIKVGILYRNDQFTAEELRIAEQFKKKVRTIAMTIISFHDLDFSFDKNFLQGALNESSTLLKALIVNHLTQKSVDRVTNVFQFLSDPDFLETVFKPYGPHKVLLDRIVDDLNKLLEDGVF